MVATALVATALDSLDSLDYIFVYSHGDGIGFGYYCGDGDGHGYVHGLDFGFGYDGSCDSFDSLNSHDLWVTRARLVVFTHTS